MAARRPVDDELVYAIARNDVAGVRAALAAGADPNSLTDAGTTALMQAAALGTNLELARAILFAGADVDATDAAGRAAIHLAAMYGRADSMALLLDHGARVDARTAEGASLVELACGAPSPLAALKLLVERVGQRLSTQEANKALLQAVTHGDGAFAEVLLERGASVEPLSTGAHTVLHLAARRGDLTLGERILAAGGHVDDVTRARETPLHEAARHGHAAFVQLLLDADAAIDPQNVSQQTPLHVAVGSQRASRSALIEVLRVLLDAGADPHNVDDQGYWVRASARARGLDEAAALIAPRPGEAPVDTSARGIHVVELVCENGSKALWYPNDPHLPFELLERVMRDEWMGRRLSAQEMAKGYPGSLGDERGAYFLPLLERMARGEPVSFSEVEGAYRRAGRGTLPTRRFRR